MKTGRAFMAGIAGGLVATIIGAIVRALGMPVNLEMMLGTMFLDPGLAAWVVGFLIHLAVSGCIGLIYGVAFERVTHRAGPVVGGAFGLVHFVIAGIFLMALPALHPLIPEQMGAPGAFMSNLGGAGVLVFALDHLVYGAVVGAIYGLVLHPVTRRREVTV